MPQAILPDTGPVGACFPHGPADATEAKVSMVWPVPSAPMTHLGRTSLAPYLWAPMSSLVLIHGLRTCQLGVDSEISHSSAMCASCSDASGRCTGRLLPSVQMLVLPEIEFEAKELATLAAVVRLRLDVQVLPE